MQQPVPVTLTNDYVTLRPLTTEHAQAFLAIGGDASIWSYLTPQPFQTVADAQRWIDAMLHRAQVSGDVPFSVFDNLSGQLAGSSSYLDVRGEHHGLEIGFTWYGKAFQRTHVNTATKLALFQHAFEVLGANRVQLQTDARNQASQRAIARLGAQREGVLRQHKVYPDGYVRDSVMFSVTVSDWSQVQQRLLALLAANTD
ncbi:MAG: GNAT family N-acetyltransferase [Pseudomonadales bacterium]